MTSFLTPLTGFCARDLGPRMGQEPEPLSWVPLLTSKSPLPWAPAGLCAQEGSLSSVSRPQSRGTGGGGGRGEEEETQLETDRNDGGSAGGTVKG